MREIDWQIVKTKDGKEIAVGKGVYLKVIFIRNFRRAEDGRAIMLHGWESSKAEGMVYFAHPNEKMNQETVEIAVETFLGTREVEDNER